MFNDTQKTGREPCAQCCGEDTHFDFHVENAAMGSCDISDLSTLSELCAQRVHGDILGDEAAGGNSNVLAAVHGTVRGVLGGLENNRHLWASFLNGEEPS